MELITCHNQLRHVVAPVRLSAKDKGAGGNVQTGVGLDAGCTG